MTLLARSTSLRPQHLFSRPFPTVCTYTSNPTLMYMYLQLQAWTAT